MALTEVDDVDGVLLLPKTNEEVIWLHVHMHQSLAVHVLQSAQQLCRPYSTIVIVTPVEETRGKARQDKAKIGR